MDGVTVVTPVCCRFLNKNKDKKERDPGIFGYFFINRSFKIFDERRGMSKLSGQVIFKYYSVAPRTL